MKIAEIKISVVSNDVLVYTAFSFVAPFFSRTAVFDDDSNQKIKKGGGNTNEIISKDADCRLKQMNFRLRSSNLYS